MRWHGVVVGVSILLLWGSMAQAQTCTQTTLNTEFMTDPTGRAYVSCASDGNLAGTNVNDDCVLSFFNAPCTNNPACKVDNILTREVIVETIIEPADLEKLERSTVQNDLARQRQLDVLMHVTSFNMAKASNQQMWKNVFTSADSGTTNAKIEAAKLKDASRAQVVCKRQGTLDDISCGLRGTACH